VKININYRDIVIKFVLIFVFWLPLVMAIKSEIRRAWYNMYLIDSIKSEYSEWYSVLTSKYVKINKREIDERK